MQVRLGNESITSFLRCFNITFALPIP